ncbi:MAG: hypothetical protein ACE5JI_17965 [Acidobacteriota bacterium]
MPRHTRIVVADTSVLINFLHLERLDLLERLPGYSFYVSEHVVAEVTRPDQATPLQGSLEASRLHRAVMTDATEIAVYDELRRTLGDGESATLAIAECRGWMVACDEKRRFRREAEARLGADRILNTVSLIVIAIVDGLVTVDEADGFKQRLAERRFYIRAASFADLIPRSGT